MLLDCCLMFGLGASTRLGIPDPPTPSPDEGVGGDAARFCWGEGGLWTWSLDETGDITCPPPFPGQGEGGMLLFVSGLGSQRDWGHHNWVCGRVYWREAASVVKEGGAGQGRTLGGMGEWDVEWRLGGLRCES